MRWVDRHSDSRWVYRGLGDIGFSLIPSAGRIIGYREARERAILEIFESGRANLLTYADFRSGTS
jgi:hypothetical protein